MTSADLLKKYHFSEEHAELHNGYSESTGFPNPMYRHRLVHEAMNQYIEDAYFWTIDHLRYDFGYNKFHKISDVFAASEQSAFFGVSEQRLGLQQDKASGYLRGISEMVKSLFQLVRELRIIDERLSYYKNTYQRMNDEGGMGSEITLKGIWVDQVEGGTKNAGSVYGLAQTVGFSVLPDIFFRVRVNDRGADKVPSGPQYDRKMSEIIDAIDKEVDSMKGFNEKMKEVLKRKLVQYYTWKMRTYRELEQRRLFSIKYLRQHYDTIKLYIGWIKPYLRNINRLQLDQNRMDSADLVSAFEGATVEIEVLCQKKKPGANLHQVAIFHLFYRTRPGLNYQQEGYQRGPAHTGRYDWTLRGYVWNDNQIKNYLRMKDEEDLRLLSSINDSLKAAMDSLGEELKKYLEEGGELIERKQNIEMPQRPGMFDPFSAVFSGFGGLLKGSDKAPRPKKVDAEDLDLEMKQVTGELDSTLYTTYKNYKKLHGMLTWV